MAAVILGGTDLSTLGIKVLQGTKVPGLTETRDKIKIIGNRDGIVDYGAEMKELYIELNCMIAFTSISDYHTKMNSLKKILMDIKGKPKYNELEFTSNPGKVYDVRYIGTFDVDRTAVLGFFKLTFMSPSPYTRSKTLTSVALNLSGTNIVQGGFPIPNPGDIDVFPIIEFYGTCTTLGFTMSNNDGTPRQDELAYTDAAITSNTKLVIDCENQTCIYGDDGYVKYNTLSFLSGPFPYIRSSRGASPYMDVAGININGTVTVKFYPRYL